MSLTQTVHDFFTGNFEHAWVRIADWLINSLGLPSWLVGLIGKALSAEFKILESLVSVAAGDLKTMPELSTDAFVTVAKDIYGQLAEKNINTFSLQYIFAMLNAAVDNAHQA